MHERRSCKLYMYVGCCSQTSCTAPVTPDPLLLRRSAQSAAAAPSSSSSSFRSPLSTTASSIRSSSPHTASAPSPRARRGVRHQGGRPTTAGCHVRCDDAKCPAANAPSGRSPTGSDGGGSGGALGYSAEEADGIGPRTVQRTRAAQQRRKSSLCAPALQQPHQHSDADVHRHLCCRGMGTDFHPPLHSRAPADTRGRRPQLQPR